MKRPLALILAVIAALLGLCVAGVYGLRLRQRQVENNPTASDLRYIVNWAGLSDRKILEVIHAYASPQNVMVGDQTKAYAMRLDNFPDPPPRSDRRQLWVTGPIGDPLVLEALKTATMFPRSAGCGWCPSEEQVNSERFHLSFPEIAAYHGQVETVIMTAYDRKERVLYHAEVRW